MLKTEDHFIANYSINHYLKRQLVLNVTDFCPLSLKLLSFEKKQTEAERRNGGAALPLELNRSERKGFRQQRFVPRIGWNTHFSFLITRSGDISSNYRIGI